MPRSGLQPTIGSAYALLRGVIQSVAAWYGRGTYGSGKYGQ